MRKRIRRCVWAGTADAGECEVWITGALAPDVLRAVLAHEVAHLATPNHGQDAVW